MHKHVNVTFPWSVWQIFEGNDEINVTKESTANKSASNNCKQCISSCLHEKYTHTHTCAYTWYARLMWMKLAFRLQSLTFSYGFERVLSNKRHTVFCAYQLHRASVGIWYLLRFEIIWLHWKLWKFKIAKKIINWMCAGARVSMAKLLFKKSFHFKWFKHMHLFHSADYWLHDLEMPF